MGCVINQLLQAMQEVILLFRVISLLHKSKTFCVIFLTLMCSNKFLFLLTASIFFLNPFVLSSQERRFSYQGKSMDVGNSDASAEHMLETLRCICGAVKTEAITWDINDDTKLSIIRRDACFSQGINIRFNASSLLVQMEVAFVRMFSTVDAAYLRATWPRGDGWKSVEVFPVVANCSLHSNRKIEGLMNHKDSTLGFTSKNQSQMADHKVGVRLSRTDDVIDLDGMWLVENDWKSSGIFSLVPSYFSDHAWDPSEYAPVIPYFFFQGKIPFELESSRNHRKIFQTVFFIICIFLAAVASASFVVMSNRMMKSKSVNKSSTCTSESSTFTSEDFATEILCCKKFSYREIALATDNFSGENMLGYGGTACVYKGYLNNADCAVAVKRICKGYKHAKDVFTTELNIMSLVGCEYIVPLIGWSKRKEENLLIYEYMENGSLEKHIFGKNAILPWSKRFKIVLDLASALLYLHEESKQCILHRDVKTANVMLDTNFSAKLGDFGAAVFLDLALETREVVGTFGYLAPECYRQGKMSKASDVYSFGIVILEVASGRKKHKDKESHLGLVGWVWELYGAGKILDAADERLNIGFDDRMTERLLVTGLWCAHPIDEQRPTIREAIQVLQSEATLPCLPKEMPTFMVCVTLSPAQMAPSPVLSDPPSITCSLEMGR